MGEQSDAPIVAKLKAQAERASDIARLMAGDKSLRQEGNTELRTDLYMWPTPEQTTEGQAAEIIRLCEEALELLADQRTAGFFTQYAWQAAEAALARIRGETQA